MLLFNLAAGGFSLGVGIIMLTATDHRGLGALNIGFAILNFGLFAVLYP